MLTPFSVGAPRLRERGGTARDALAAMTELESQHRGGERLHAEIDELVGILPRDGSAEAKELDRLNELVAELTTLYRPHILLEDNFVFPIAAEVLPASEIQALGEESGRLPLGSSAQNFARRA